MMRGTKAIVGGSSLLAILFVLVSTGAAFAGQITNGTSGGSLPLTTTPAAPAAATLPLEWDDRWLLGEIIVAVGLLAILVACVWQIAALHPRRKDTMGGHRVLFEALADLDEDREAGRIGEQEHADRRALIKVALLAKQKNAATAAVGAPDSQT